MYIFTAESSLYLKFQHGVWLYRVSLLKVQHEIQTYKFSGQATFF
jgi:hypothetical protein